MLLEIVQAFQEREPAGAVPFQERVGPEVETERLEEQTDALVLTARQETGQDRVAGVEDDADRDGLAVGQGVSGQGLQLVGRPVTVVERAARPGLEGIAALGNLLYVE